MRSYRFHGGGGIAALSLSLLICCASVACAATPTSDGFPSGPITLMIAQAPGGASEAGCRIWQPYVEKELGVPLNFEFYEGASGQIGLTVLQKSEANGYNLGMSSAIAITYSMELQKAPYTNESFETICIYHNDPGILMAHKDEPYNNLTELIAYAKTLPPESLTIGVPAITDVNVVGLRQLEEATGVKFNIVSFNGGGKARTALAGHHIPMGAFMYYGSTSVAEETKIIGVNVANTKVEKLQGKQTFNDAAGKKLDDIFSISNIYVPAGFRAAYPERYQFLTDAFRRAFNSPELEAHLKELDQVHWLTKIVGEDEAAPINKEREEFCLRNLEIMRPK